jgi:hypothetical protein
MSCVCVCGVCVRVVCVCVCVCLCVCGVRGVVSWRLLGSLGSSSGLLGLLAFSWGLLGSPGVLGLLVAPGAPGLSLALLGFTVAGTPREPWGLLGPSELPCGAAWGLLGCLVPAKLPGPIVGKQEVSQTLKNPELLRHRNEKIRKTACF